MAYCGPTQRVSNSRPNTKRKAASGASQLTGKRIHDLGHGPNTLSREGENLHGKRKNSYGDRREKARYQDGINVAAHSLRDTYTHTDGTVAQHVAQD